MMRKIQNAYLQQDEWGDQQVILIDPKTKEKIQIADCGKSKAIEARCEFTPAEINTEREELLAKYYALNHDQAWAVAQVCDHVLDKSGAMLGRVRELARKIKINKE